MSSGLSIAIFAAGRVDDDEGTTMSDTLSELFRSDSRAEILYVVSIQVEIPYTVFLCSVGFGWFIF